MAEPKLKLEVKSDDKKLTKSKNSRDGVLESHTEEIVVGLCGPIGTNIHLVADIIKRRVENLYDYETKVIKLSDLIREYSKNNIQKPDASTSRFGYYNALINEGNLLRETHGHSILADLAINEITVSRSEKGKERIHESKRICYIIDSIKNEEELEILRLVYRDVFYFIGVFSHLSERVNNLKNESHMDESEIYQLIDRDSGEEIKHGQKVSNTFMEADFFLRIEDNNEAEIEYRISRFLNLVFGSEITTPTYHETAMYQAYAAAGNSACLSRQVGACITDSSGEVLSIGWNDVPKYSGGVYSYLDEDPTNKNDKRCFATGGICHNDKTKNEIVSGIVSKLASEGIIKENQKEKAESVIRSSRIKGLIEFSRAVHAEMLAIIFASQVSGERVRKGILFCTTYPCHNCARHIVAAGIEKVYFIEPYRKSLAINLHSDAITESPDSKNKVKFLMFSGVSPKRYLDFFKAKPNSRKKDGLKISIPTKHAKPKASLSLRAIPYLEAKITESLQHKNLINSNEEQV